MRSAPTATGHVVEVLFFFFCVLCNRSVLSPRPPHGRRRINYLTDANATLTLLFPLQKNNLTLNVSSLSPKRGCSSAKNKYVLATGG